MDAIIGKITKDFVKAGEKKAPIKSVKLKVKFDTSDAKSKALKNKRSDRLFADKGAV
ncbi:MAG: hypothetical protein KGI72_05330 [Patescibacteria group bacterium]|nr:hypothetical protein [Patescibacteria group bacterium]MDE2233082.1 hypothetical protein [Patescibacteria group bacterium]